MCRRSKTAAPGWESLSPRRFLRKMKITMMTSARLRTIVNCTSLNEVPDRLRAVVENIHRDRRRDLLPEHRHQFLDRVGNFDGIAPGLPLNRQDDRSPDGFRARRTSSRSCRPRRCRRHCPDLRDEPSSRRDRRRRVFGIRQRSSAGRRFATSRDRSGPYMVPVGMFTFQFRSAVSTSFIPICRAASFCGSRWTRTAYFCAP